MNLPIIIPCDKLSNEQYHNGEWEKQFCSSSTLKLLITSPKYAKYCMDHPEEKKETESMSQGSVYHSMLASLTNRGDVSDFEKEYLVFIPPVNKSTGQAFGYTSKAYQEAMQDALNLNPGKSICSEGEKKIAESMIDELLNGNPHLSPQVNNLIKIGTAEQSRFLEYEGQKFKYRTDLHTAKKIVDWKKTRFECPKTDKWDREIIKYNYHISAAFYQFFEFLLTGKWKDFYWIAQESEPPYDFNILSADEWTFEIDRADGEIIQMHTGGMMFQKLLDYYILCAERNQWPGYSIFIKPNWIGQRIAYPTVPGYYQNQQFEFFDNPNK